MAEQMQIDFLQLLQDSKKEEVKVESKPVKEKVSKEVKTKEKKQRSFEEQYKLANHEEKIVIDYLLTLEGMKEKMERPEVSISSMWDYIKQQAKKRATGGSVYIADEEVFGWGRHYYDEHGKVAK